MNEFEKYIRENKKELDLPEVNPKIFLEIENKILQKKQKRSQLFIRRWAAIAAVLLIGFLTIGGLYWQSKQDYDALVLERYGLQEYNFAQQIKQKKQVLASAQIPKSRVKDFNILLQQLEFLDTQYHDYLEYTEENGYQEFIGNQILNYYKSKIELLEKIQSEIEKIEDYESKYQVKSEKSGLSL